MSQQDHHSPNPGLFAGRRVTVVQSDTLNRDCLVGRLSALCYQEAGVITSQQMALLQRLLPRTRLESLLGSIWFQRRLDAVLVLSRKELQQILRAAGSERSDWLQQLGDPINLAEWPLLWHWVLYPLHRWWVQRLEPLYGSWLNELEQLQVMRRQLNAQSVFWQTVVEVPADLEARISEQLAQLSRREQELRLQRTQCEERLQLAWPAWYARQAQGGDPALLMPVPIELGTFWQSLRALPEQPAAAKILHAWLVERGLALAQDHFYWQPPER
ncbi:T3SS regulon anti-activator ExsD domain-containing protein [Aeromonas lusitana]|uniref:ExsD protein n=1 Tax=Aeromonas lusitana TaxID=931529 RepID=A0A2M8HCI2_9GAMM|nr:T3SS regulon anti-activator ExsD domain-containing protein [Aeromonas lusitana]PJC94250.1 ExsD protein [Aeromonas lusitana]